MTERNWHDLSGKNIAVYGASRGLGREVAIQLAAAGARVVCGARGHDGLEETVTRIAAAGGVGVGVSVDIGDEASITRFSDEVVERYGRLDVVVNCAGIMHAEAALRNSADAWRQVLEVNLTGAFLAARAAAERMKKHGGRIILFGSVFVGRVLPMTAAYTTSKAGVHQMVRSLAIEWARYGITVNGVAPGYFETEMPRAVLGDAELREKLLARIPLRRVGEPAEIGPLVHYLASDASGFMTGSILPIDGGQSLNVS